MVGARATSGAGTTRPAAVVVDRETRRLGLYLALGGLMVVLDTTVTIVAIPGLIGDFGSNLTTVQWVTTGYVLGLVAVMPLSVWATQRFGPRRSYLAAITVFIVGSLLAGCAWNVVSLISFRVLQGAGGGLINPVGMSIALSAVHSARRGAMMSLQGLPVLIGPLIGPLLGGLLIDHASWRWIFWINVPIGVLAILAGRRILLLPHRQHGRTHIDVVGLLLLSPGIAVLVLGLSDAGLGSGLTASGVLLPVSIGVLMIAGFVRHALRVKAPLVQLRVLRIPAMRAGAVTLMLFVAAYFGSAIIGPAYVQIVRGDSATITGAIGIPQALATGISLQIATRLVDRVQPRRIVGIGIAVAAAGTLARVAVLTPHTPYALFIIFGAVSGLGIGATLSPTMTAATRLLTGADLTTGSTVLNLSSQTATALGTALTSMTLSWLATLYAPSLGSGGISAAARLPESERQRFATDLAHAAQGTLALTALLMVLALLASRRLPQESRPAPLRSADPPVDQGSIR